MGPVACAVLPVACHFGTVHGHSLVALELPQLAPPGEVAEQFAQLGANGLQMCTAVDEQLDNIGMAGVSRAPQWGVAVPVLDMDASTTPHEVLHLIDH